MVRPGLRRAMQRALGIIAALCALFVVPFIALLIPSARQAFAHRVLAFANTQSDFRVRVDRVDRLDPWGVTLQGLHVRDVKGAVALRAQTVSVRIAPFSLLGGEIELRQVSLSKLRGHIHIPNAADEPETDESQASSRGQGPSIHVRAMSIHDAAIETRGMGPLLSLRVRQLEAAFAWGAEPWLYLERADLHADGRDGTLLRLHTRDSHWDAERGGTARLDGTLAGAPLLLTASMLPVEGTVWPKATLRVHLSDLRPEAWRVLGLESADVRETLTLDLRASCDGSRVGANLKLTAGASRAQIQGEFARDLSTATVSAGSPDLSVVSGRLPGIALAGRLNLRFLPQAADLTLHWHDLNVDDTEVPSGHLAATLNFPSITLRRLVVDSLGDTLHIAGAWHTELAQGHVELALKALELSALPAPGPQGLRGRVNGQARVALHASGQLSGGGALTVDALDAGAVAARAAQLRLTVLGTRAEPRGTLALGASQLAIGGTTLDRARVELACSPSVVQGKLSAHAQKGGLEADVNAERDGTGDLTFSLLGTGALAALPISLSVHGQHSQLTQRTQIAAHLAGRRNEIKVRASLHGAGAAHSQLDLNAPHLEDLSEVLRLTDVRGGVKGQLVTDGPLLRPNLTLTLAASELQAAGSPPLWVNLDVRGSLSQGDAQAQANVWTERRDAEAALELALRIPKKRNGTLDFVRASQETALTAHVPLNLLKKYAGPGLDDLRGALDIDGKAQGTLQKPRVDLTLATQVSLSTRKDLAALSARVALHVDTSEASMQLSAHDLAGELLAMRGNVRWPGDDMGAALAGLGTHVLPPFEVELHARERRLDTMQGVVGHLMGVYKVNLPIRVRGDLTLQGEGGDIDGSARAKLVVFSDKLDPACAAGADTDIDLSLDLKQQDLEAQLRAHTAAGGSLAAYARSRLLYGGGRSPQFALNEVTVDARGSDIKLPALPGLCRLDAGTVNFRAQAKGLGSAPPVARLQLQLTQLAARGDDPISVELTAVANPEAARAKGQVRVVGKPAAQFAVRVPFASGPRASLPALAWDDPVSATLAFDALPLSAIASFSTALGRPRGSATGTLKLGGTLNAPMPEAVVELHDGAFSVASIAQPFRDIDGRISLRGRTLRVHHLSARDRDGRLQLDGEASLHADGSGLGDLRLQAQKFPLRRQGQVVAHLTTQLHVQAGLSTDHQLSTQVKVNGGRIWLSGDQGRDVQSLEPLADVHIVDAPRHVEAAVEKASSPVSLASFTVKTGDSLWVMHRDFTVQVGLDVAIEQRDGLRMEGVADIRRGHVQLLGKPFRVKGGAITFTGDFPPDPELELHAEYDPKGGQALLVDVTGRSSAPNLVFSGAANTAGEAVMVLSGASRSGASSEAQTDARNFATGLTAGLLSVSIREEFGDWVPIMSIENNGSGVPARGRVGFDASKLIPAFLRGIARGAYVEGIVGSSGQTGRSVGVGARLEVSLPRDFVTSVGYGPGPTWGTDLMWEP